MAPWGSTDCIKKEAKENNLVKLSTTAKQGLYELPHGEIVTVNLTINGQEMNRDQARYVLGKG